MSDIPPPDQQSPDFSNYPRTNAQGGSPYQRPPGVYFDSIGQAWELVKRDLATWLAAILVAGVIGGVVALPCNFGINYLVYGSALGATSFSLGKTALASLMSLVPGLFVGVVHTGVLYMGLKQAPNEPISVGDVFAGFRKMGTLMLAVLIYDLAFYLGFALLIVPSFFVIGALAFVQLLVLDQNLSAWEAVVESYNTLRKHAWAMFALLVLTAVVVALGVCVCCVGVLFTAPIYAVTLGLAYNNFYPAPGAGGFQQQIGVEPPR